MASREADARPGTVPVQVRKRRSFALAADKLPLFPLSRVEIALSTARTATDRNRVVDEVVAAAGETVAGIAATDRL